MIAIKASLPLKKMMGTCTTATIRKIKSRITGIAPSSAAILSKRFDFTDFPYTPNAKMGENMKIHPIKIIPKTATLNPFLDD